MGLFSLLGQSRKSGLSCDWCGKEMENAACTKHEGKKRFVFCSEACKNSFRKSGKGKRMSRSCPSCPTSPKSWD